MISIFAIYSFLQVSSYLLIMDNQVNELNLYKILDEDQEITIWVRFQTQFIFNQGPQQQIPFLSLNSQISKEQIILKYEYDLQLSIIITFPDSEFPEYLISKKNYDKQTWLCITLLKEQLSQMIILQNKTLQLPPIQYKDHQYYENLITWQNLTFSLKAFKGADLSIQYDYFYIQNTPILKLYKQIVMNYKSQIKLEMYLRQYYQEDQIVLEIKDSEYNYSLFYGYTNLTIVIQSEFKIEFKQFLGIPRNKWFKFVIDFELDKTITTVKTTQEQYEYVYENKQIKQIYGKIAYYYGIMIQFYNKYIDINNILIVNNKTQDNTNFCFPGCKKCQQMDCLECENNLELSNQCSCENNQFYDDLVKICKDITQYPSLIQNQKMIHICNFYEYFNTQQEQCLKCPRIDQYYCTDCVYNTDLWKINKTCTFQEIYSEMFLKYLSLNYQYSQNKFYIVFDQFYSKITDQICEFYQEQGLIYCQIYDWDYLVEYFCDLGEFDQFTHKCNLRKGVFHQYQNRVMCSQKYTLINFKCLRCPRNCVICIYNLKTIQCVITNQGSYIDPQNFSIRSCIKNPTMCTYEALQNQDIFLNQTLQLNQTYCKLFMNNTCLLCVDTYFLDSNLNCIEGKDISKTYNFEYFSTGFQQLTYPQLLQFATSQIPIKKMSFQQILFYGLQYENIKQNDDFTYKNNRSHCLKFKKFNNSKKCLIYNKSFNQFSSNDLIYYCPNDKCTYNLTLDIKIYISNSQQIIYQNISFISIQEILDQLILKFYVLQITFMTQVYVFETFDQECFDQQIFMLDEAKLKYSFPNTKFKLVLMFQSFSQFPQCWENSFNSNFQSIQVRNLSTNSVLQIEFHSDQVEFIKCKFQGKAQIQFILHVLKVSFENTTFIHSVHDKKMIQIFHESNVIQEIKFLQCNFVNLKIQEGIIFIQIISEIQLFVIYNMSIFEVQISNSIFIQFHKFQIIHVELMFIGQNIAYQSNYFNFELSNYNISSTNFNKINILDSQFFLSKFLNINHYNNYIIVQNLQIIDSVFINSVLFEVIGRINFMRILFQGLQLDKSRLIYCQAHNDNLIFKDFEVIDTYFNQSETFFILTYQINMENILIKYCNYYPFLNIFTIKAEIGFIEVFTLQSIKIDKQYEQLVVEIPDYLLNFQIQHIRLNFVSFENITIIQAKLLYFSYFEAHISNFFLENFQLIGGSLSELILLLELNQSSVLHVETISIINIDIMWFQSSKLFYIQGNQGQQKFLNLVVQNILSIYKYQIFYCSKNRVYFKNIFTKFYQFIGFIKQQQSMVKIQNYKQYQNQQLLPWATPVFTNIDPKSYYETIFIFNSTFINLVQPICLYKHNKRMNFHIQNVNIFQFYGIYHIFEFQLENYQSLSYKRIVFYLIIEKLNLWNILENRQVFLKCVLVKYHQVICHFNKLILQSYKEDLLEQLGFLIFTSLMQS